MAKAPDKPALVVANPAATDIPPPRTLGPHGLALWNRVQSEYRIDDAGGMELLMQICTAADRVEALAERIRGEGEIVHTRNGPRAHPALREELSGRAFICRQLRRLGILDEPIKPMGRPPTGGIGWRGPNAY
jgi:hypothetical protein